jgi:hypothetical protein
METALQIERFSDQNPCNRYTRLTNTCAGAIIAA